MKTQILVVDDDLSILKLLNFILAKDYDIIIKNSGLEALSWLEEGHDPALIISDLQMPYLDGQTFVRNLKISGFYKDTPIIVLSGTDNLGELVADMPYNIDSYLHKPFNPTSLKEAITKVLNLHDA
ncbi:two-component system response regulator [Mucilaginibacter sp. PPCGB 2223]|uniref:response regulator n=1 Tax=Mucilaginibacter sp. PPCGB 2223 TaxID=1886027 RepID=UPI0008248FE7|nr:response regulator [Mucilaginibacter sp. PPCGB 2223]OCX51578.1 two-component system response regulator [Mucilaginibacter sp. PPCGB 2223]